MNDKTFFILIAVVLILAFAISYSNKPLTNNEIILMAHFY